MWKIGAPAVATEKSSPSNSPGYFSLLGLCLKKSEIIICSWLSACALHRLTPAFFKFGAYKMGVSMRLVKRQLLSLSKLPFSILGEIGASMNV